MVQTKTGCGVKQLKQDWRWSQIISKPNRSSLFESELATAGKTLKLRTPNSLRLLRLKIRFLTGSCLSFRIRLCSGYFFAWSHKKLIRAKLETDSKRISAGYFYEMRNRFRLKVFLKNQIQTNLNIAKNTFI